MVDDNVLMSPKDRYKKEYLGGLISNDIERYSEIMHYTDIQEEFTKYVESLGFKKEHPGFFHMNVGVRKKESDKIYIWLGDLVDNKYDYSPYKTYTITFRQWVKGSLLGWYDRCMFDRLPITDKERVEEVLKYSEYYYKLYEDENGD